MNYLVHHLVEASARRHPERIAVVDRERSLTYAQLDERANRLAHLLAALGVTRGDRVGLYLDKSLESVVGIYGILKAGAAYVPLDPYAPAARLGYIAANCGLRVLVTGAEKAPLWGDVIASGAPVEALVVLNAPNAELSEGPPGVVVRGSTSLAMFSADAPRVPQIAFDLAYILYTSGSTGEPKGVMLSHQNALAFVEWSVEEFGVAAGDRLSGHAPLHFDLSVFDLFAAAHAGAAVVLVPPETSVFPAQVARFIAGAEITIWYSVPSILSMLALRGGLKGGELPTLRTVLFAGEVFPTKFLRTLMTLLPHVRFYNLYGPTETNVCTFCEVAVPEDGDTEPVPIGKAIPGVEVFAVADDGGLAAPGQVGELCVRGPTVMQGYWADAERTARARTRNPFRPELDDPVYRTGDLVRADRDGTYRLLGRRDNQIKSRGYRIELGEIESALYAHPGVVECAVVAVPDELVTNRIKACVVVRDGTSASELAAFCATRLPRYMVPEAFDIRSELPKTTTGKVDRRALVGTGARR